MKGTGPVEKEEFGDSSVEAAEMQPLLFPPLIHDLDVVVPPTTKYYLIFV